MKSRAIVTFLDYGAGFMRQYQALEYCWRYTGMIEDTDLVVFCCPDLSIHVSSDCKTIPYTPQRSIDINYEYLKSIEFFLDPVSDFLRDYEDVLKTDLDVFLTPNFKNWRTEGNFYCGSGAYWNSGDVQYNILEVCKDKNLNHNGNSNIGSTWYGSGDDIVDVGKLSSELTMYILDKYFQQRIFNWPNWTYGVSSMYASEIAVNHVVKDRLKLTNRLDQHSDSLNSTDSCYHVHCWHTDNMFSKFAWMDGLYDGTNVETLNINNVNEYCLMCALKSKKEG